MERDKEIRMLKNTMFDWEQEKRYSESIAQDSNIDKLTRELSKQRVVEATNYIAKIKKRLAELGA